MVCHNAIKTLPIQCHLMSLRKKCGWLSMKRFDEVEPQLFEKLVTEPIKKESKYVHGKLKTWKERIKTNFHGQDVPCDMYCNATAALQIDSIYK